MDIDIEKLTLGQLREIARACAAGQPTKMRRVPTHSLKVGQAYFIRTVTMHYTGRVVAITATDIVLEDACWIADSGRFSEALTKGTLAEVEPFPGQVIVGRGGFIDAAPWTLDLPRARKP